MRVASEIATDQFKFIHRRLLVPRFHAGTARPDPGRR
jgi:hypothetical protein